MSGDTNSKNREKVSRGIVWEQWMLDRLDELAEDIGVDRSTVVRLLVNDYFYLFTRHGYSQEPKKYNPKDRIEAWLSQSKPEANIYKAPSQNPRRVNDTTEKVGFSRNRVKRDQFE